MKEIAVQIEHLNRINQMILIQLDNDEPSGPMIQREMNQRQLVIQKLSQSIDSTDIDTLSEKERKTLLRFFDEFEMLDREIQAKLKELLNKQKVNLASASSKRKAEDEYFTFKKE